MLNWIAVMLIIYISLMILVYLGDYIIIKTHLKYYKPITAEIIDLDYAKYLKGGEAVTIVTYEKNGKNKDAIITNQKKDKIGDKVEIITDGVIAIRAKKNVDKLTVFLHILLGFVMIGYGYFMYSTGLEIPTAGILVTLLICGSLIASQPFLAESSDRNRKRALGWHNYKMVRDAQQETDDMILICVVIVAVLIIFFVLEFITKG